MNIRGGHSLAYSASTTKEGGGEANGSVRARSNLSFTALHESGLKCSCQKDKYPLNPSWSVEAVFQPFLSFSSSGNTTLTPSCSCDWPAVQRWERILQLEHLSLALSLLFVCECNSECLPRKSFWKWVQLFHSSFVCVWNNCKILITDMANASNQQVLFLRPSNFL